MPIATIEGRLEALRKELEPSTRHIDCPQIYIFLLHPSSLGSSFLTDIQRLVTTTNAISIGRKKASHGENKFSNNPADSTTIRPTSGHPTSGRTVPLSGEINLHQIRRPLMAKSGPQDHGVVWYGTRSTVLTLIPKQTFRGNIRVTDFPISGVVACNIMGQHFYKSQGFARAEVTVCCFLQ